MIISLIAALAENRVIGRDNDLPWRLRDDMRYFMRTTSGHTVVMGRRTWESMGGRPLPHRRNVVVTRQPDLLVAEADVVHSLDEALDLALKADENEVFICGGSQLYAAALPIADRLYLTHVHTEVEGDTRFPEYDPAEWRRVFEQRHEADADNEHAFTIAVYERR